MARYRNSRVFPIALVLIIVAVAIAALVSVTRAVFFPANDGGITSQADVDRSNLLNKASGRAVKMSVRGPIVANEVFRSYEIKISPSSREFVTYQGYLDKEIDKVTLGNNSVAYEQFVHALDKANLIKGKELAGDANDTRGVCARGDVYTFDLLNDNKSVKNLWTSTCSGINGSLDASVKHLRQLFIDQIPGSAELIRKIDL